MTIATNPVAGRPGWHLGDSITSASETRAALTHVETGWHVWVWGDTDEERRERALKVIDHEYQRRWDHFAELIDMGDFHGPNVKLIR